MAKLSGRAATDSLEQVYGGKKSGPCKCIDSSEVAERRFEDDARSDSQLT